MAKAPIFIVSTGRCGSMTMAKVFNQSDRFMAFHEPRPYLRPENFEGWIKYKNNVETEPGFYNLKAKRDWLIEAAAEKGFTYVESSHFLSFLIKPLYDLYTPRFIHLVRDGRDFVRSGAARKWYTENDITHPLATSDTDPKGHRLIPPTEADTRFKKLSWLWAETNRGIREQLKALGVSYFTLKIEDLTMEKIAELEDFIGQKFYADKNLHGLTNTLNTRLNETASPFILPPKDQWSPQVNEDFLTFAKDEMQVYGYL